MSNPELSLESRVVLRPKADADDLFLLDLLRGRQDKLPIPTAARAHPLRCSLGQRPLWASSLVRASRLHPWRSSLYVSYPTIPSVYASTRAEELKLMGWDEVQKARFIQIQFNAQSQFFRANYPGAQFQIIEFAGQPIGRLYVHEQPEEIRIMDIALLPGFRGKGAGAFLLRKILLLGQESGRVVTIHVQATNPAARLYARLGFQNRGSNGLHQLMEWAPESRNSNGHLR